MNSYICSKAKINYNSGIWTNLMLCYNSRREYEQKCLLVRNSPPLDDFAKNPSGIIKLLNTLSKDGKSGGDVYYF